MALRAVSTLAEQLSRTLTLLWRMLAFLMRAGCLEFRMLWAESCHPQILFDRHGPPLRRLSNLIQLWLRPTLRVDMLDGRNSIGLAPNLISSGVLNLTRTTRTHISFTHCF